MGGFGQVFEGNILNKLFRGTDFTTPTNVFISAHTGAVGETGANEVVGNGYVRVTVAATSGEWTAPTGNPRQIDNINAITFPTATGNQGTITDTAAFDAATVGNMIIGGALVASKAVDNGDTLKFNAGDFNVLVD